MNKFELMRKIICGLMVWNLVLTTGLLISFNQKQKADLDSKICNVELIPLEIIEEEF